MSDRGDARLARIESKLDELERRVSKMEEALYGDGGQGIISRLSAIEARLDVMTSKINTNTTLAAGTFLGIVVTLISILIYIL